MIKFDDNRVFISVFGIRFSFKLNYEYFSNTVLLEDDKGRIKRIFKSPSKSKKRGA